MLSWDCALKQSSGGLLYGHVSGEFWGSLPAVVVNDEHPIDVADNVRCGTDTVSVGVKEVVFDYIIAH